MGIIKVTTRSQQYDVHVENMSLDRGPSIIKSSLTFIPSQIVLIVDEFVVSHFFEKIKKFVFQLNSEFSFDFPTDASDWDSSAPMIIKFPASLRSSAVWVLSIWGGEGAKSREVKAALEDCLVDRGCDRKTLLIAVGGGTISDLVGFVAGTYYRGIPFVCIPTTFLSMVDSAVGGKTAVNSKGKNLLGLVNQPTAVIVDLEFLTTATRRDMASGLAEVVKLGVTSLPELFAELEEVGLDLLDRPILNFEIICRIIETAIAFKSKIVSVDERDSLERNILNFGHSVGHAIETESIDTSASPLLHGECVAIGITSELLVARRLGWVSPTTFNRVERLLLNLGLPTRLPQEMDVGRVMSHLEADKKNSNGKIFFVAVDEIGTTCRELMREVPREIIKQILSPAVMVTKGTNPAVCIRLPGSKSIANRALLLAALSGGGCCFRDLPLCDDIRVMKTALKVLFGIEFVDEGDVTRMSQIERRMCETADIWVENSGTVARFIPPVVAAFIQTNSKIRINGNAAMQRRPIGPLVDAMRSLFPNLEIKFCENENCLPISISRPANVPNNFPNVVNIDNNISSQFVSALLMIAPLGQSTIKIRLKQFGTDGVVSQQFIDMTITLMSHWGVDVERCGEDAYRVASQRYQQIFDFAVEGDATAASYPIALGHLVNQKIKFENFPKSDCLQSDVNFINLIEDWIDQSIVSTNLSQLTDCFMTAAVVAAKLLDKTKNQKIDLVGIGNQRDKECNRIAAMVKNLQKLGIPASELDDGLRLSSPTSQNLPDVVEVDVHDDHRLAMSFAVFAAASPNQKIIIPQWRCVEKTYATFWDDLAKSGCILTGVSQSKKPKETKNQKLILIGMRNCGKTTLGREAAKHFPNFEFVDLDEILPKSPNELIRDVGWDGFREIEADKLREVLTVDRNVIIACGGGVVESQRSLELLESESLVVWLRIGLSELRGREVASKAKYVEPIGDVFTRRDPRYKKVAKFHFEILSDEDLRRSHFTKSSDEILKFSFVNFCRSLLVGCPKIAGTNFVTITKSLGIDPALYDAMARHSDFFELRCDLLAEPILEYFAARSSTRRGLILTYRSTEEGGAGDLSSDNYFLILLAWLKLGPEFLDVEATRLSSEQLDEVCARRGKTKLIFSRHTKVIPRRFWEIHFSLMRLWKGRPAAVLKLVFTPPKLESPKKLLSMIYFAMNHMPKVFDKGPVVVCFATGEQSRSSRLLVPSFSPVYSKLIDNGILSQYDAMEFREFQRPLNLMPTKKFFIVASSATTSPSPYVYRSILPADMEFGTFETSQPEVVERLLLDINSTAGVAVSIPLKVWMTKFSFVSADEDVQSIGSINTLLRFGNGWKGYNTDWMAVGEFLFEAFGTEEGKNILVIGAGGAARAAAYAVKIKKHNLVVWNRTRSQALSLAEEFDGMLLDVSQENLLSNSFCVPVVLNGIISAVPGDALPFIPDGLMTKIGQPFVCIEMAYRPPLTALLKAATAIPQSLAFDGFDFFRSQHQHQAKIFLGRDLTTEEKFAARRALADVVKSQNL